jgi:hypothetical protein
LVLLVKISVNHHREETQIVPYALLKTCLLILLSLSQRVESSTMG